jgi:hypothetical protein
MTFDEMQLIMQSIAISQREIQTSHREMQTTLSETQLIVKSIARGVQAMQDKALSDELKRDEERAEHQVRMEKLERISEGLINMLDSIDDDRPTILRKLNTIEDKADVIIERLSRD